MKNRIKILVLISVFLCSYTNLIAKEKTVKTDIQKELLELSSKNSVLEKNIQALSLEKTKLHNKVSHLQTQQIQLEKQHTDLEEIAKFNIEQYHDKTKDMLGLFSILVTLLVAIVGMLVPFIINKSYNKRFEAKNQDYTDVISKIEKLKVEYKYIKRVNDNNKVVSAVCFPEIRSFYN